MKKKITVITTSRADWSYLAPLTQAIKAHRRLDLRLVATGSHFFKKYGNTYKDILAGGEKIHARIPLGPMADTEASVSRALADGAGKFSREFAAHRPDLLVVFGDRMEILSIVLSAVPFRIPLVHIGGGDITEGAVDEGVRHAVSKLAHLHFVHTMPAKKILEQMGEEPWRVHYAGSLGIDSIQQNRPYDLAILRKQIPFIGKRNFLLVTLHPQTISNIKVEDQIKSVLKAFEILNMPVVFTYPNMDMANQAVIRAIERFTREHRQAFIIRNAGTRLYYSWVCYAAAVVGNSSSAIYDTPFLATPAVNIGGRQAGRLKAANVIDVDFEPLKIVRAVRKAISPAFRRGLTKSGIRGFFGHGRAAQKIVAVLEKVSSRDLLNKKFRRL